MMTPLDEGIKRLEKTIIDIDTRGDITPALAGLGDELKEALRFLRIAQGERDVR